MDRLTEKVDKFGMPLEEMARLGDFDQYSFWVYREPLKNPSFHLKHKTDFEIVIQVLDMKILEIKHNNSKFSFVKGESPPKAIASIIKNFMAKKSTKNVGMSNAEAFDFAWKLLNDD